MPSMACRDGPAFLAIAVLVMRRALPGAARLIRDDTAGTACAALPVLLSIDTGRLVSDSGVPGARLGSRGCMALGGRDEPVRRPVTAFRPDAPDEVARGGPRPGPAPESAD